MIPTQDEGEERHCAKNVWGPGLSLEEQERRLAIVTRIGAILLPALFSFVFFAAAGGLHIVAALWADGAIPPPRASTRP